MRWLAVGAIVLVGLLYARPLRSYFQTKHDLARRAAEVRTLKGVGHDLPGEAGAVVGRVVGDFLARYRDSA